MGTAIFKQKNGLYAVVAASECGVITPDQLQGLNSLIQDFNVKTIKMSTRQTLILVLPESSIDGLIKGLAQYNFHTAPFYNTVRNVKGCSGSLDLCPRALGDALALGIEIQKRYMGIEVPHDFKIATAGCSRGCTDPMCADYGVICHDITSFDIYIGGKGAGKKPVHGQLLVSQVNYDDVFNILDFVLDRYRCLAQGKERLHQTIARVGLEKFQPTGLSSVEAAAAIDHDFLNMLNS